jgi:hypothetical protein
MRLPPPQPDHRTFKESSDAIDDVAVGHRNANDWGARLGGSATEKSSLALEDSGEPVELKLIYDVYMW